MTAKRHTRKPIQLPPQDSDVLQWQRDFWLALIEYALNDMRGVPDLSHLEGFLKPAVIRHAVTTPDLWHSFDKYNAGKPYHRQVRPFGFMVMFQQENLVGSPDQTSVGRRSRTRLDEFAELRPHFIKIDIEGAELLCLRGAKNILSQAPAICLEFHPEMIEKFGVSADELFKILSTESYRVYVRYEGSSTMERYKFQRVSKRCWFYCVPANRSEISRTYLPD